LLAHKQFGYQDVTESRYNPLIVLVKTLIKGDNLPQLPSSLLSPQSSEKSHIAFWDTQDPLLHLNWEGRQLCCIAVK
jgi:hypothetical protein